MFEEIEDILDFSHYLACVMPFLHAIVTYNAVQYSAHEPKRPMSLECELKHSEEYFKRYCTARPRTPPRP